MQRRVFLRSIAAGLAGMAAWSGAVWPAGVWLNDVHSQLNRTLVAACPVPASVAEVVHLVRTRPIMSAAGGRHAAGRQQFCSGAICIDTRQLDKVLRLADGHVEVEAGIQWKDLLPWLEAHGNWTVRQKQGIGTVTLGGTLGANAHGNGLSYTPIVGDVRAFRMVTGDGVERRCSRQTHAELFALAIGGYGLFGIMTAVELRVEPIRLLKAAVAEVTVDQVLGRLEGLYGSCQLQIDPQSDGYMMAGVLSCYRPVDSGTVSELPPPDEQAFLDLATLSHVEPGRAFAQFASSLLARNGLVYRSNQILQDDLYVADYHHVVDARLHATMAGSEVLFEMYLPRTHFTEFCRRVQADFRAHPVQPIYVTVRFVETDSETFLPWARQRCVCIAFNLHTVHTPEGIEQTAATFRRLLAMTIELGGSYYLTYHPWATREQLLACYPQLPEWLRLKSQYDPNGRFQSDWYHSIRRLLQG